MLTKRTYSIPVLVLLVAFPAVALAAPGNRDDDRPRTGLADARPASPATPNGPAKRFERAIEVHVERIRAARRARLAKLRRRRREAQRREQEAFAGLPGGVSRSTLEAIAACESGGDPTIVSADGSYRGKYQFSYGTWESVGGSGDPAAAPEAEQDYRAALLYAQSGSSPWPVCG